MANPTMDPVEWLRKQLEEADVDLLREIMRSMAGMLMSAEVAAICGMVYRESSEERVNSRNGHRQRPWNMRVESIDLEIPELRQGSYYPAWLLEPGRRAEQTLANVVADSYLTGVSTRRAEVLTKALVIEGISRSQIFRMTKSLDEMVASFRSPPSTADPTPISGSMRSLIRLKKAAG